jgi:hypothetical protein
MNASNDPTRFGDAHIPAHLPFYPPAHTYSASVKRNSRKRGAPSVGDPSVEQRVYRKLARRVPSTLQQYDTASAQKSLSLIEDRVDTMIVAHAVQPSISDAH